MASKTQTLGIFTVVDPGEMPRVARKNGRESQPLSEELVKLSEDLTTLYQNHKDGKVDLTGSDIVRRIVLDARKAADHAGLGLGVGIETWNEEAQRLVAVRFAELPKATENDGVAYRLTLRPKEKTVRTRKTADEATTE